MYIAWDVYVHTVTLKNEIKNFQNFTTDFSVHVFAWDVLKPHPKQPTYRLWGQYRAPVGREHAAGGCRAQRPYERSDLRLFRREREVLGIRWGDGRDVRWWW